jgi:hypothetical protein
MSMLWYQWMAIIALGICLFILFLHFLRLVRAGKPKDFSKPSGSAAAGIRYAFTGAMSPAKKESAYLHLPTYTAGLLYHIGTFLSFFLFFFFLAGIVPKGWIAMMIAVFLFISSSSGIAILTKRMVKKELLFLSNPDDFISNILVSLLQILTILMLLYDTTLPFSDSMVQLSSRPTVKPLYYLSFTLLMLYVPAGKLRHLVYFFAARYHLGYFFGWRGVWPPNKV